MKKRNYTSHNLSYSSEYRVWADMLTRCYNKKSIPYKYYGERGITVCDKWKSSFLNFIKDMGLRPSSKYSLDRINNDGNYEPSNCRWATRSEQYRNRRFSKSSYNIPYKGVYVKIRNKQFCGYFSTFKTKGKIIYLGQFQSAVLAAIAHDKVEYSLFKNESKLNFPHLKETYANI